MNQNLKKYIKLICEKSNEKFRNKKIFNWLLHSLPNLGFKKQESLGTLEHWQKRLQFGGKANVIADVRMGEPASIEIYWQEKHQNAWHTFPTNPEEREINLTSDERDSEEILKDIKEKLKFFTL